jgi:hypothetical protein
LTAWIDEPAPVARIATDEERAVTAQHAGKI